MTPREDAFQAILVRLSDTEAQLTEFKVAFEVLEELAAESRKTFDTQLAEAKTQIADAEERAHEALLSRDNERRAIKRIDRQRHEALAAIEDLHSTAADTDHMHTALSAVKSCARLQILCMRSNLASARNEADSERAKRLDVDAQLVKTESFIRGLLRQRKELTEWRESLAASLADAKASAYRELHGCHAARLDVGQRLASAEHDLAASQQREAGLAAALLGVRDFDDGDGKPCWCCDGRSEAEGGYHSPPCLAARAALAAHQGAPQTFEIPGYPGRYTEGRGGQPIRVVSESEAREADLFIRDRLSPAAHRGAGATCDYCQAPAHPNHCDSWVCGRCGAPNPNPSAALSPAPAKTNDKET